MAKKEDINDSDYQEMIRDSNKITDSLLDTLLGVCKNSTNDPAVIGSGIINFIREVNIIYKGAMFEILLSFIDSEDKNVDGKIKSINDLIDKEDKLSCFDKKTVRDAALLWRELENRYGEVTMALSHYYFIRLTVLDKFFSVSKNHFMFNDIEKSKDYSSLQQVIEDLDNLNLND